MIHACPWQYIMGCFLNSLCFLFPLVLKFLLWNNSLFSWVFSQVPSSDWAHEWYTPWFPVWLQIISFSLIHECYLDWVPSGYTVFCVQRCYFTVLLLPVLHKRTANASLFSLCTESILFTLCLCYFSLRPYHSGGLQDMPSMCLFSSVQAGTQRALSVCRCRSFVITDELSPIM